MNHVWFLDMMCFIAAKKREKQRETAKNRHRSMKRKTFEFGKHHHYHSLSFSVLDFVTVRKRKIFMLEWSSGQCMNSRCSMSSQTVENGFSRRYTTFINKSMVWKGKHEGEKLNNIFSPENSCQLEQYHAKTVTSVSWKLGDNRFPAFVVFLT